MFTGNHRGHRRGRHRDRGGGDRVHASVMRRRRLQQRFGPEYDRVVGERNSRHKAEAELTAERERRVADLDIPAAHGFARGKLARSSGRAIQERFVDAPGGRCRQARNCSSPP
jgi:hypothetical protein